MQIWLKFSETGEKWQRWGRRGSDLGESCMSDQRFGLTVYCFSLLYLPSSVLPQADPCRLSYQATCLLVSSYIRATGDTDRRAETGREMKTKVLPVSLQYHWWQLVSPQLQSLLCGLSSLSSSLVVQLPPLAPSTRGIANNFHFCLSGPQQVWVVSLTVTILQSGSFIIISTSEMCELLKSVSYLNYEWYLTNSQNPFAFFNWLL